MKKETRPDFMWHLDAVVIPFPVAIVTTVDAEGRVNAAPFGLILPFNSSPGNPQILLCSNRRWHTARNIAETGEFVINYAPFRLVGPAALTGLTYDDGVNEIEKANLTAIPALKVTPPRIQECFQHIECRLNRIIRPSEYQDNFIGDVLAVTLDEELTALPREERLKAADPLLLYGIDITSFEGNYAGVGATVRYKPPVTDTE